MARMTTNEMREELLGYVHSMWEDEDHDMFMLVLPVACDAGVLRDNSGEYHLMSDENFVPLRWMKSDPAEDFYRYVAKPLIEQIQNASTGQIAHYHQWATAVINLD